MGARPLKKTDITKHYKEYFESLTVEQFNTIMEAVLENSSEQNKLLVDVNKDIKKRFTEEGKTLETLEENQDKQD